MALSARPKLPLISDYDKVYIRLEIRDKTGLLMPGCEPKQPVMYNLSPLSSKGAGCGGLKKILYTMRQGDICWASLNAQEHSMGRDENLWYRVQVVKVITRAKPNQPNSEAQKRKSKEQIFVDVVKVKDKGNGLFREGKYEEACKMYWRGWCEFTNIKKS